MITGDVYLVMQSGDTKRGSGRQVYLIQSPDSIEQEIRSICASVGLEAKHAGQQGAALLKEASELADKAQEAMATRTRMGLAFAQSTLNSAEKSTASARELGRRATLLRDSTLFLIGLTISRAAIDSASAGINAHYRFDDVPPGRYALYSQWTIGENDYRWWVPISVQSGDSIRRDLDNRFEAKAAVTCGLP